MPRHIALLRAVNVTGHNKLAMADLRTMAESLGFEDVQTILQSGNLVFSCAGHTTARLEETLQDAARAQLGLDTDFMVRTVREWRAIIDGNPMPEQARDDPAHLLLLVLKAKPAMTEARSIQNSIPGREKLHLGERHAYIHYADGVGRSKLTTAWLDKKLGTRGTARNWNTVLKLAALVGA
ncbi:MAG: DUF1697 domain-containing protein [Pseudomonadota bacterium]